MKMEFMVHITNTFPADGDKELLSVLAKAESVRAAELAAEGLIKKIWRRTGKNLMLEFGWPLMQPNCTPQYQVCLFSRG